MSPACMASLKKFTDYRFKSDVILGFYQFILGNDLFRTLERTKSNPAYYTTLIYLVLYNAGMLETGKKLSFLEHISFLGWTKKNKHWMY